MVHVNVEETELKQEVVVKEDEMTEEDPLSDIPVKQGWIDDQITFKGEIDIEICDLESKIDIFNDTKSSAMEQ